MYGLPDIRRNKQEAIVLVMPVVRFLKIKLLILLIYRVVSVFN